MKKLLLYLLLSPHFCVYGYAQAIAAISFVNKDSVYNFGSIAKGTKAKYQFEIENTGDEALIITYIKCKTGDFIFQWPKKPLKPHKKSVIYVTYSPSDQIDIGSFNTDVYFTSNATQQSYPFIHISGEVIPSGRTKVLRPPPGPPEHEGVIVPLSRSNPPQ